jgi:hypothetical protein
MTSEFCFSCGLALGVDVGAVGVELGEALGLGVLELVGAGLLGLGLLDGVEPAELLSGALAVGDGVELGLLSAALAGRLTPANATPTATIGATMPAIQAWRRVK